MPAVRATLVLTFLLFAACAARVEVREDRRYEAHHPAYVHALEDLRVARSFLERPAMVNGAVAWDENVALREIDAAGHEIREASIDDGKNPNDHPPVDAHLGWPGRLHRTLDLLRAARRDVEQEEDNGWARGLRNRSIGHIDAAIRHVEQGIALMGPPPANF